MLKAGSSGVLTHKENKRKKEKGMKENRCPYRFRDSLKWFWCTVKGVCRKDMTERERQMRQSLDTEKKSFQGSEC